MRRSISFFLFLFILAEINIYSEDDKKKFAVTGYASTLESAIFDSLSGPVIYDNVIHNRVNLKIFLNSNITFSSEFRNRLFTGDMVKLSPSYAKNIAKDIGWMDLSWNILDEPSFFLNTTIDRLSLDFNYDKFQARIGRQRINWGQTLVWNPNDIFNAYSFFDFDYVERPGSDAVRLQYYPSFSSVAEIAVKADNEDNITAAALYRFNKWGYDIQFLSGCFNSKEFVAGAGWSGAFGSLSFRGEISWFQSFKNFSDTTGTGIFTIGIDRSFKNSSLLQFQIMYCNKPVDFNNFLDFYSGTLSTKELAFSKLTPFALFSYPVTPLLNLSVSGMLFPDMKGYYAGPSLDFSMSDNVDFSLYWQHFRSDINNNISRMNMVFLRIKYSF